MADPYKNYINIYSVPANANCPMIPNLIQGLRDNAERSYEMTNFTPKILFHSSGKCEEIEKDYDYALWPISSYNSMLETWVFIPDLAEYTKLEVKMNVEKEVGCADPEIKVCLAGIYSNMWSGTGWKTFEINLSETKHKGSNVYYGKWCLLQIIWRNPAPETKLAYANSIFAYLT